jgi:hypothetical protein
VALVLRSCIEEGRQVSVVGEVTSPNRRVHLSTEPRLVRQLVRLSEAEVPADAVGMLHCFNFSECDRLIIRGCLPKSDSSADAFYNDGATSGSLHGTPWVDPAVAHC